MADSRPPVTGYPVPPSGASCNGYPPAAYDTAYPYAAPPPQYNSYQHHRHQRRCAFIRCFLVATVTFFVVAGAIIFILWLVLRLRIPQFGVQSFKVTNFSVVDSQHVSGTWQVGLLVANPNVKADVSYDTMDTMLYYRWSFIAVARIPPFEQRRGNQTAVSTFLSANAAYVTSSAVNALDSDRAKGTVPFQISVLSRVRFKSRWWWFRSVLLRVRCDDLAVGLSSSTNGTANLVGGERACQASFG